MRGTGSTLHKTRPIAATNTPPAPAVPLALPFPPLYRPEQGVVLRPWGHPGDAAALARAWADPAVARFTSVPKASTEADAARWVSLESARRDKGMAVDLVIASPEAPDLVLGEVGLAVVEPEKRWAEVGYWVVAEHRGRGLASVSVGLFSEWALRDLPISRLFARTSPENPGSGLVAERAGYTRAGQLEDGTVVWMRDPDT